jgi:hypothetical protein
MQGAVHEGAGVWQSPSSKPVTALCMCHVCVCPSKGTIELCFRCVPLICE